MIVFDVYGTPAPQGSKRFVGRAKSGRGILVESSKAVAPWREAVKPAALRARAAQPDSEPLDGPLRLSVVFSLARPKSAPKRRKWPDRTPDLSKLIRATEDALTDAGVWTDDARVCEYGRAAKVYAGSGWASALDAPGARIWVEAMS